MSESMILQKIIANDTKSATTKGSRKIEAVPKIFGERGAVTERAQLLRSKQKRSKRSLSKAPKAQGSQKTEPMAKVFWERGGTTEQAEVLTYLVKTEQVEFVPTTQGGVMVSTGIGKYEERAAAGTA